jgi:hypothetical protein
MKVFVSRGRRNKNLSSTDPDTTIWLSLGNFFKSHKTKQLKRKNNYISFFSFPYFLSNQPKDKARFGWKKKKLYLIVLISRIPKSTNLTLTQPFILVDVCFSLSQKAK